ncbi:MAG: class I SAM-dependent methyltransferase, partial [Candidatus Brocadiales bacterium]
KERKRMKTGIQRGLFILILLWYSLFPPLYPLCSLQVSAQERRPGRLFPPERMQVLEEPRQWQDAEEVMDRLRLREGDTVADIGAGTGYFTLPMARRVGARGLVYAEDVQQAMVDYLSKKVETLELKNIRVVMGKADNPTLPEDSLDLALVANTYHEVEKPLLLLENIRKELKSGGRLVIIDWGPERESPVGPPQQERVSEDTVIKETGQVGLDLSERQMFMPYHYFLVFKKR